LTNYTKDFRVKNGLVVDGSSITVAGNNVLTTISNLENLLNVNTSINILQDSDVLTYDNATSLWINKPVASSGNIDGGKATSVFGSVAMSPIQGGNAGSF
jgi:hypothetical protein